MGICPEGTTRISAPLDLDKVQADVYRDKPLLEDEGHYMLWAVAIDDKEASSQSYPAHVHVGAHH